MANQVSIRDEKDEQKQVKRDLVFVLVLNGLFFAALIGLYFYNGSTGAVDQFFAELLKF